MESVWRCRGGYVVTEASFQVEYKVKLDQQFRYSTGGGS